MVSFKQVIGIIVILALLVGSGPFLVSASPAVAESELCQGCQQSQAEGEFQYPIMRPSPEAFQRWVEAYNQAPKAPVAPVHDAGFQTPAPTASLSLLDHLQYTPSERNQLYCGNCWVWAGTGIMEVALDVQNGIKDRLSIQYLNSNYNGGSGTEWACCGGWLSDFASFYTGTGQAIPWSNTNAAWQDGGQLCEYELTTVPAGTISTTPNYPITSITAQSITTHGVGETAAIANIKNILDQNKAVTFSFFLATTADWNVFFNFWAYQGESAIGNPNFACGHTADSGFGGHSVLCVGYNDEAGTSNDYWIMLNSWGTTPGRPNGLFRLKMHMDYDCYFYDPYPVGWYSFYWETLDVTYATGPVVTSVDPGSALPGQTLDATIGGNDFTGATAVSFGADITVNSFTVDSDTQITANITVAGGAALGMRDVSVTTPEGTGTLTDGFEVVSGTNTPPVVSNVTASQGSPIVNITYDVSDAEQSSVDISFEYWDGSSWQPCLTTAGEGTQSTGTGKSGTWDAGTDFDEQYMTDCKVKVTADDGQAEDNIGSAESSDFTLDTKDPTGQGCNTPGDGTTGISINPTLTCLTASDDSPPISYYFQLAENDIFTIGLQESGWQSSTSWSPSALSYDTQYFWRVKARDNYDNEAAYGSTFDFTTLSGGGTPPTVETYNKVFNITETSATLVGNLTDLGTASSVNLSFIYGTTPDCADGEGVFRVKTAPSYYGGVLSGLSPGTLYYYRAKAVGDGTSYGTVRSFTTAGSSGNNPPNAPTSPLCEGLTNPTGVTNPNPEFSWTFSDPDGGDTQGAYQLLVASTPGNLTADIGDMWDTGKVSGSTSLVSYAGTTLGAGQTYYWKVKTWDNNDAEGPYCSQQQFTTASAANTPPVVSNVTASQSSPTVDITYDVSDAEQSSVDISFEYWDGASWQPCLTTIGEGTQSVGTGKSGTWDAKADFDEQYMTNCQIRVTADDGQAGDNIGTGTSSNFTLDTKDPTGHDCDTPGDGATGISINPTLTCLTASDDSPPISYYFQLAENGTFTIGLQESGWQSSTSWSPSTLSYDTQYFWRVKAKDNYDNEAAYGSTFDFTTLSGGGTPPTVETYNKVFNITETSVALVGNLTDLGTASSVNLSFIYGTTPDCADGEGVFRVKTEPSLYGGYLYGLSPGTLYYYRAKAVGDGTSYGEVRSFTTAGAGSVMAGDFGEVFFSTSWQLSGSPFPAYDNIDLVRRFYLALL